VAWRVDQPGEQVHRVWRDMYKRSRHPKSCLNTEPQELMDHIEALSAYIADERRQAANDWLISNLDTIDRKAQGLLLLSAIVLTIAAILYPRIGTDLGTVALFAIVATMALLILSCVQLALINFVYWTSTEEFRDTEKPNAMLEHLLEIRELRTRIIWVSCMLDVLCLVAILLLVVLDAIHLA
jgi:hypothetical protein